LDIQKAWWLSDVKTQLLRIAYYLSDDPNYAKEDAVMDLLKLIEFISDET
jgi:hypothetical protein